MHQAKEASSKTGMASPAIQVDTWAPLLRRWQSRQAAHSAINRVQLRMNGLLLPVKGLTCTSASPQGDPQPHVHIREHTRTSASPRAYPRPSAQDCRARSALTHIDNHSPAHRHPGTRPQPRIRGTQPRPRQLEREQENAQRNSGRTPREEYKKAGSEDPA